MSAFFIFALFFTVKLSLKYFLGVVLSFVFATNKAQIISPLPAFSFTNAGTFLGQVNALVEDTLNNQLHYQNSCNCGVGPGNIWNALTYVNLNTYKIKTPIVFYGPSGTIYWSKGMNFNNGRINTFDSDIMYGFNSTNYAQQWTFSKANSFELLEVSAQRNDSLFLLRESGSYCKFITLLNATTGSVIPFPSITCFGAKGHIAGTVKVAKIHGGKLYLGGKFYLNDQFSNVLDSNFVAIKLSNGDVELLNYLCNDTVSDIEFYRNKLYVSGNFTSIKGQARSRFAALDLSGNLQIGTPAFNAYVDEIEVYDDYVFALGKYTTINGNNINPSGDYVLKSVNLKTNSIMNWNLPFTYPALAADDYILEIYRNRLYVASRINAPYAIDGFCLPPIETATTITTFTTAVCEGSSNVNFSVPAFLYANSYSWLYTGTGATLTPTGNSVSVNFANGATGGKIKVVAGAACGSKSDTVSLSITILPKPNAIASLVDDTLNCFKPKVPLSGNSFSPNVSYQWSGPSGYFSANQNDSTGLFLPGTYVVTVTSNSTGCKNTASVTVKLDTLKPNVTLPSGPYIIPCNPNFLSLNGTSTTTPALLQWRNALGSTWYANPYPVTSAGNYVLMVQSLINGCKSSDTLSVSNSTAIPTVTISSHPFYTSPLVPADTITCLTPSVQVTAIFSPTNCSLQWKDLSTGILYTNPITVVSQGNYMPIVTRLDNNCTDSSKIVYINQNITPPAVAITTPSPNINCSYSTATLNAVFLPGNCAGVWSGPGAFNSVNPAVAAVQGQYCFTATDPSNGCVKKDSVNLGYSNTLIVNAGNDTIVCKGSVVPLTAVVAGTVSSLAHQWSNGATTYSTIVNATITSNFVINVNGSGCSGTDMVRVIIPADIRDSVVTSKGCTGNSGNLIVYAKGGIPPYVYSVNNSAFSSVASYSNLSFATHTVIIKDSIGCIKTSTVNINQSSNSVQPVFIASTQNFKGDTVVFVDLTVPKADSVKWVLPGISSIIGGDMYSPVVVFADTGTFAITMQAFYANCMISATKTIRILPFDTAYASFVNNNGIKSVSVNPNPNNGQFTVQVEFYKKQNASIQIWDAGAQKQFQQNFSEVTTINLPMNLSSFSNGIYLLRVIGEYSSKHLNFVISK